MTLLPSLTLGWLNAWTPVLILYGVFLYLLAVRIIWNHFLIPGEEKALADQYCESYLPGKKPVPRN